MTLSMYQASVPVFLRMLNNLSAILDKAEANATSRKIDPGVFIGARLAPDMFPLSRQVQLATDFAKGGAARLSGQAPPKWEDTEKTFAELKRRIDTCTTFLKTFTASQIDGSEERDIELTVGGKPLRLKGQTYLLNLAMPNFYFHVATAYDILRHNGVEVGKRDFVGAP